MTFSDIVSTFLEIIDLLVVLVFALTLLVFLWGITRTWILNVGDEAEVEKGKKLVVAGIIGLTVMSGIWGILALLRSGVFGF